MTVCSVIKKLEDFWNKHKVKSLETWDMQMGAATFHPMCFLYSIKNNPFSFMYMQPSRRPSDGKYGRSPNRVVRHHQFQVIINPFPLNIQELYLESLYFLGLDKEKNDIKFVENNWESTALGAFGVGWEVWVNGMEVTQFTFFTKIGDIQLENTVVELAYGLERLVLALRGNGGFFDLEWDDGIFYRDLYFTFEQQASKYYLEMSNKKSEKEKTLEQLESKVHTLIKEGLFFIAYELILEFNQVFNLLISGRLISHLERKEYLNRMRSMVHQCGILAKNSR